MIVTLHRIAKFSTDAIVIGFEKPFILSLYAEHLRPIMTLNSAKISAFIQEDVTPTSKSPVRDDEPFHYHHKARELTDEEIEKLYSNPNNYEFYDDSYSYYSSIDLSHLSHEQHKAINCAISAINDATCGFNDYYDREESEDKDGYVHDYDNAERLIVDLDACTIQYMNGYKTNSDHHPIFSYKHAVIPFAAE